MLKVIGGLMIVLAIYGYRNERRAYNARKAFAATVDRRVPFGDFHGMYIGIVMLGVGGVCLLLLGFMVG